MIRFSIHGNDYGSDMRAAACLAELFAYFQIEKRTEYRVSLFTLHLVSVYLNNKCDFHRLHV